jgi:hypothetical protein
VPSRPAQAPATHPKIHIIYGRIIASFRFWDELQTVVAADEI